MEGFSLNVNGIGGNDTPPRKKEVSVVWECQDHINLDYKVVVLRTEPYRGLLTVAFKGGVFYTYPVPISFDAQYGVDMDDYLYWADLASEVTQAHERLQGESK
jgi:hypothetical protein